MDSLAQDELAKLVNGLQKTRPICLRYMYCVYIICSTNAKVTNAVARFSTADARESISRDLFKFLAKT